LARPVRFERPGYALEEFVTAGKNNKFNDLQHKKVCAVNRGKKVDSLNIDF